MTRWCYNKSRSNHELQNKGKKVYHESNKEKWKQSFL